VFSKDRPMQLDACLRSLHRHCPDIDDMDVKVLWTVSDTKHKEGYLFVAPQVEVEMVYETVFDKDLLDMVDGYEYVMFLTDDTIFVRDFKLSDVRYELGFWKDSIGMSLRLGWNTVHSYMTDKAQDIPADQFCYPWGEYEGDFNYPLEISSSVYRLSDILPLLSRPAYNNPNTLEAYLDWCKKDFEKTRPCLCFYNFSRAFSNPLNKVQTVFTGNRSGFRDIYNTNNLTSLFLQGYSVNVEKMDNYTPSGVHEEVDYEFVNEKGEVWVQPPEVTVCILNYNGKDHIEKALESVYRTTKGRSVEVIVWDNGSMDGSVEYLKTLPKDMPKVVFSEKNIGVQARANMIAMAQADYIVVMDNDVILTSGWLDTCLRWSKLIPDCGIIAPMSNYASGPQKIDREPSYDGNIEQLEMFAKYWGEDPQHRGNFLQTPRLPSFLWFITPECLKRVGNMRSFGKIFYEDDDYSIRATISGLKVVIDQGWYVHHAGGPKGRNDGTYNRYMMESWEEFKKTWKLPEDFKLGKDDYITWIVQNVNFNPELHYIPIDKEKA